MSLLHIFPQYRSLESKLAEASSARIEAEDQVRFLQAKLADVERQLIAAQADAINSVKLVADWASQQLTGKRIYFAAPELPEEEPNSETLRPVKRLARDVVAQAEREFEAAFSAS